MSDRVRILLVMCLSVLLFPCSAPGQEARSAGWPGFPASIRIPGPIHFCGEPVPLDNPEVREHLERELLNTAWNRPLVTLWIKRSGRYMPHIVQTLKQADMPEDLKYVAVIESALRPHAGSPKGAVGYWQFIAETGRKYGLTIDGDMDERRSLLASTDAALRYLRNLYSLFGNWTLAAAAYNMGEEGLQAEILLQRARSYYDLHLSLETQQYVFRILAAKLLLLQPERYGFQIGRDDLYPPLLFDRATLPGGEDAPIAVAARAAQTSFKTIKDLNPEIRGHYIPRNTRILLVPKGTGEGFAARFDAGMRQWRDERTANTLVVQPGDTLSSLARRHGVPVRAIAVWNRLPANKRLTAGEKIIILPAGPSQAPGKHP